MTNPEEYFKYNEATNIDDVPEEVRTKMNSNYNGQNINYYLNDIIKKVNREYFESKCTYNLPKSVNGLRSLRILELNKNLTLGDFIQMWKYDTITKDSLFYEMKVDNIVYSLLLNLCNTEKLINGEYNLLELFWYLDKYPVICTQIQYNISFKQEYDAYQTIPTVIWDNFHLEEIEKFKWKYLQDISDDLKVYDKLLNEAKNVRRIKIDDEWIQKVCDINNTKYDDLISKILEEEFDLTNLHLELVDGTLIGKSDQLELNYAQYIDIMKKAIKALKHKKIDALEAYVTFLKDKYDIPEDAEDAINYVKGVINGK